MKNEIIVLGKKEKYKCCITYPGNDEKAKLINQKLDALRLTLREIKYSKDISKVNYELYVYESKKNKCTIKKKKVIDI